MREPSGGGSGCSRTSFEALRSRTPPGGFCRANKPCGILVLGIFGVFQEFAFHSGHPCVAHSQDCLSCKEHAWKMGGKSQCQGFVPCWIEIKRNSSTDQTALRTVLGGFFPFLEISLLYHHHYYFLSLGAKCILKYFQLRNTKSVVGGTRKRQNELMKV